jgi:hypothetical protein
MTIRCLKLIENTVKASKFGLHDNFESFPFLFIFLSEGLAIMKTHSTEKKKKRMKVEEKVLI